MLKLDNGVWVAKWMIHEIPLGKRKETFERSKYIADSDIDSFKILIQDIFEMVGLAETFYPVESLVDMEMWLNILRRKYI
jgi:radical SAM superfamily enzyme